MKDVVQLVMDDNGADDSANHPASFIKQKRTGRQAQGKKSAQNAAALSGNQDGSAANGAKSHGKDKNVNQKGSSAQKQQSKKSKKKGRNKTAKTDQGAQALFDEIDRGEGDDDDLDDEESDEGPGLTFHMDEFDEKPAGNADKQGGRKAAEVPEEDQMLADDY